MINFTVFADAEQGKSIQPAHRPRIVKRGRHASMANDPRHDEWMAWIGFKALPHRPAQLLEGPLKLTIDFYLPKPKSTKSRVPISRPDLSNYVKAAEDAMNGILYVDDARIIEIHARKLYGLPSRVEITIEEVAEEPTLL
jgi:Holliday junction resolvase RusA-like endonuclease